MATKKQGTIIGAIIVGVVLFLIASLVTLGMWGMPKYRIYSQDKRGIASLREAEWTKKIAVESAKARELSASFDYKVTVKNAEAIARANEIIGKSLKDNKEYLQFLWVEGLKEPGNRTIYIPTDNNLPITEAGRAVK